MAQMKAYSMPMKKITLISRLVHLPKEFQNCVVWPPLGLAITVILFGVLASEFNAESKNMNRFAGERREFFGQKTKGGTLTVENFQ